MSVKYDSPCSQINVHTYIQSPKVYDIHRGIKAPEIWVGQALVL